MDRLLIQRLVKGIAACDAIGASTEFLRQPEALDFYLAHKAEGFPFRLVGGGWLNLPPGQHTDDTDMALVIVQSFMDNDGTLEMADLAFRWVFWLATDPPDVGGTCRRTLSRIGEGVPPFDAGFAEFQARPDAAANGALMRNGVVAGLAETLDQAFEWSLKQGIVTHYGPLSVLCCGLQTWLTWELFEGRWPFQEYPDFLQAFHTAWTQWVTTSLDPVVKTWLERVEADDRMNDAMRALLDANFDPDSFNPFDERLFQGRDGYCLLSLQVALWALQWARRPTEEFPFPVPATLASAAEVFARRDGYVAGWIALIGHDSDTYGAILGAPLVAAIGGELPTSFTEGLAVLRQEWLFSDNPPAPGPSIRLVP